MTSFPIRAPRGRDWPRVFAQNRTDHHIMEVARGSDINFRYVASGFDPTRWIVWIERSLHDRHKAGSGAAHRARGRNRAQVVPEHAALAAPGV